jgi:ribonucleoside-diphosphate reductase alpha chain
MCLSIGLQSGVPISWFTDKLRSMRFEPSGTTNDPEMPRVTSLMDGLARWLRRRYTIDPPTDEHET